VSDKSFMIVKKETTYGTDSVPTAVEVFWAENVQYKIVSAGRVRGAPAKPGVGQVAGTVYGEHAELTFEVPLMGSGTAGTAPKWGPLPKACGWAEAVVAVTSVTYSLAADPRAADSATIVWSDGRRLHKILGFRGRMGVKMTGGQRPVLTFAGRGLYVPVTTRALPAHADATWTGWLDALPIAQGVTTFSFAATAVPLRELSLDPSDNVLFNDLPHQENVQLIGPRTFSGKLKITTQLPSTLNLETPWQAGTISTLALVHGTVAGKIVTVNIKVQNGEPDYGDDKGEDVTTVDIDATPSALNLDDEIAIILT
jgi:hypothetical protein